jgi:hypothetical protein
MNGSAPRRLAIPRGGLLLAWLAVAAVGCGNTSFSPSPSSPPTPQPTTAAVPTPIPSAPRTSASPEPSPPSQTTTAWGRIWDGIPAWFPRVPGTEPADQGTGPTSASLLAPADVPTVSSFLSTGLAAAGYKIETGGGPLEDGSMVLDAVGRQPGCRAQLTLRPMNRSTLETILFGAGCPFR